jgi:hypothetical protein
VTLGRYLDTQMIGLALVYGQMMLGTGIVLVLLQTVYLLLLAGVLQVTVRLTIDTEASVPWARAQLQR